jgi:hypothetical protein
MPIHTNIHIQIQMHGIRIDRCENSGFFIEINLSILYDTDFTQNWYVLGFLLATYGI